MYKYPVILAPDVASCPSTRTVYCNRAGECARAVIDGTGRVTQDYSIETRDSSGACRFFVSAASNRPVPNNGPKVHKAFT